MRYVRNRATWVEGAPNSLIVGVGFLVVSGIATGVLAARSANARDAASAVPAEVVSASPSPDPVAAVAAPTLAALPAPVLEADRPGTRRKANLNPKAIEAPQEKPTGKPTADQVELSLAATWLEYDMLPPQQKGKKALKKLLDDSTALLVKAPAASQPRLAAQTMMWARERMAPLMNPASRALGDTHEVLVPSPEPTACLIWGSQWSQPDVAASLRTMGFESIACEGGREWDL